MIVLVACLKVVFWHLSGDVIENQEKLRTWSQYLDRISNWIPTKYECRISSLLFQLMHFTTH